MLSAALIPLLLLGWLSTLEAAEKGAKILFYNSARVAHSHMAFMAKIADLLAEHGHNVVGFTGMQRILNILPNFEG